MTASKLSKKKLAQSLLTFLKNSPTPFHATKNMAKTLEAEGYIQLKEPDHWKLKNKGKYFVLRNHSSLIAFQLADQNYDQQRFHMVGAHTDSPALKLKPNTPKQNENYLQLGVEVYGGALLNPWFDRDLSLAGRISYENKKGELKSLLLDFKRPIAIIPSLAIHLDRQANEQKKIHQQKDLPPIFAQIDKGNTTKNFADILIKEITQQNLTKDFKQILSHELYLYDTQPASLLGLHQDFITGARLDNLLSCHIACQALLRSSSSHNILMVASDHEEVGSNSYIGADGNFLPSILARIYGDPPQLSRAMSQSMLISTDNAHGIHPNFPELHEPAHRPLLNGGPVIKINHNQRYATNSETEAFFTLLCKNSKIPFQKFVMRSGLPCGSTIGPLTASQLGIRTIDVGVPTFAMHSIREMAGAKDPYYLYQALTEFFSTLIGF